jgi:glucokinase
MGCKTMTSLDRSYQAHCAIGVDVGGTKCAAGLILFPEGRVLARRRQPSRPQRGGDAVLKDVVDLVRSLQNEAHEFRVEPVSIGLGVAELVGLNGELLSSATIQWQGVRVDEILRAELGIPAIVEADVRTAARGEARLGAGRNFGSFLYITIGTGISASLVINGSPYAGAQGLTGTFASSPGLFPGAQGELVSGPTLEEFASGPALAARFAAMRDGFSGGAPEVVALAEGGHEPAGLIVASAAQALGAAVANLVNMLDPEAVIVGGGLGATEGLYRQAVDAALRAHIWSDLHRNVPLLSGQLGEDAGVIGAALTASQRQSSATSYA